MKCPQDKENIVRSLVLKDHLEAIGCTLEAIKGEAQEESKAKEE
jgi:hypothetical protein